MLGPKKNSIGAGVVSGVVVYFYWGSILFGLIFGLLFGFLTYRAFYRNRGRS